jgi:hypothetical protein
MDGAVRSPLLCEPDHGVEGEDRDDDGGVGVLLEQERDDGRGEQDEDQRAAELADEQDEVGDRRFRDQPVLAGPFQPFRGFGAAES